MTLAVSWQAEPDEEPLAEVVDLNQQGFLTRAALDTVARLRRRAREQTGHATATDAETGTEPNLDDRFPEEPPF
jgi:hypothetical protein